MSTKGERAKIMVLKPRLLSFAAQALAVVAARHLGLMRLGCLAEACQTALRRMAAASGSQLKLLIPGLPLGSRGRLAEAVRSFQTLTPKPQPFDTCQQLLLGHRAREACRSLQNPAQKPQFRLVAPLQPPALGPHTSSTASRCKPDHIFPQAMPGKPTAASLNVGEVRLA